MFNQNRIYRVFQLINFLKANPPKTIASIEQLLQTSGRTVYRYLDLLAELGFHLEKDGNGRLFITGKTEELLPFTAQEAQYLKKLVLSSGKKNKLAQSVLQKIHVAQDIDLGAESLFKAHLAQIVEKISMAIMDRKQILLKGYHSANSESVRDRLVEPMRFTENYTSLSAFEIKTKENKFFNIERISAIEVLSKKMKFESYHQFHAPDCFGFQGSSLDKEIEFTMSMRAYLVLKDEFPMAAAFAKNTKEKNRYHVKTRVQSFKAPARFVLGFHDETDLIGSKEFIKYVSKLDAKKVF